MSTSAVPRHTGNQLQTATTDTMNATNQSELLRVCRTFLSGLGIDRDRALSAAASFDLTSAEPAVLRPQLLDLAAVVGARDGECVYVSTPITTGRHHLHARDDLRHEVISGNLERAKVVVESVRAGRAELVIDPTGLEDVPGWAQEDYHDLWVAVIARFARTVIFVDDWQYSVGCTKEFTAAYERALPIFSQDLRPLRYDEGRRLLGAAAAEVHAVTGAEAPLLDAIAEFDAVASAHPSPDAGR